MKAKDLKTVAKSREALLDFIETTTKTFELPYPVDVRITEHTGIETCYAVFWIWCRSITEQLKERWPSTYAPLDANGVAVHDALCKMFLGKKPAYKVGKIIVEERQITLTDLKDKKGEMLDLLRRIEEWAISMGIYLPQPKSEYTESR